MKYMMLIAGSEEAWSHMTPDEQGALMQRIGGWWGEHSAAGRIIEGYQLEPVATATTVRRDGDGPGDGDRRAIHGGQGGGRRLRHPRGRRS